MDRSVGSSEVARVVAIPAAPVVVDAPRTKPRTEVGLAARTERAALLGSIAAFLGVASAAALSTMQESVRWPALVTFFASLSLAGWARRVLGRGEPPPRE